MNRSPLAAAIAQLPGLAERLTVEHTDDGTGRCRVCKLGAQRGFSVWPCSIRIVADAALAGPDPPIAR